MDVTIKLALVDDHKLFRKGLVSLINKLNHDYSIMFEANNGVELQQKINNSCLPDIIIMDVNMPEMNGFESVSWLHQNFPEVKVLVVSMVGKEETILRMIKLGVKGYLSKDVEPKELGEALQSIFNKGSYYTDFVTGKVIHSIQNEVSKHESIIEFHELKEREQEFIRYACTEMTYNEIADKMCLSPKTVDGYRKKVFEKLNVKNRVGLVLYAIKAGWVKL
ncbi:response regulator transcription factor [Aquimarina sp. MMG016]|uniref:response regulator transcription factor n=1 Tax=Aquimarina sp. MMG016 TaxID=2822690 RepID=UPI001B3A0048|nr:response regulator transcription factor [Aquimarina sp. MMG016]MBQ4818601.1 response regulator transcription factor [Aquimarina sp. MMG016]